MRLSEKQIWQIVPAELNNLLHDKKRTITAGDGRQAIRMMEKRDTGSYGRLMRNNYLRPSRKQEGIQHLTTVKIDA